MLALAVISLAAKALVLRRSVRELANELESWLDSDTNVLIGAPSRDREVLRLTEVINRELQRVRREHLRYTQGDRELKDAVAGISHDLRTPLTAMRGYLDLLEREEMGESARRYSSRVRERADALQRLADELFVYSVSAHAQELAFQSVDVVRALEESLLAFHAEIMQAGIEAEIFLSEEPIWKNLDPSALSRVFANVIGNAIKYSAGDLRVQMDEVGTIIFSNKAPLIDPIAAGRLFDRFYTVEASRGSTGLGLSVAKVLTERMGGSISARYERGELAIIIRF